ncbi:MAG: DUF4442 domain-containing protein [Caulobacterales bacterium]|nr:DUF4442 domain-containing protein [Caulobacterales bacterium]
MTPATQDLLDSIAYIAWHGCKAIEQSAVSVKLALPPRDTMLNYVGATHAGAIFTLAETAAGVVADSLARPLGAFILLRGAEVKYTRRALGELVATALADEPARRATAKRFADDGRADLSVAVEICDGEKHPVFEGAFHYALRPRAS